MGKEVPPRGFSHADRQRYRQKVRRCLDVFALMLNDFQFDTDKPLTGLEIELNLIDDSARPAMKNAEVLNNIANPAFQTELGQFNIEVNMQPRLIAGNGFDAYEDDVRASLLDADQRANKSYANIVVIGILPTLMQHHSSLENLSPNPRYLQLNEQIIAARGEDIYIDIRGPERLQAYTDSIAPEAACTSIQHHLQVSPETFANYWNASQAVAGVQLALGANSPFFYSKQLWAETRIALFEQATDTRPEELKAQGVRPRVWFGERWITSIFDLFEENVRYFPPLLPIFSEEDPVAVLESGGLPELSELRLHNGTVYRWNRPVYDIMNGRPHLRVENRVLPAGPTVVDMMANGAFYFGLVRTLAEADRPIWTQMTFSAAEENFHSAARRGIDSSVYWPRMGERPATELVLDELLPKAYEGLDRWGVAAEVRDRLLGIIEGRCVTRRNGATWQIEMTKRLAEDRKLDRVEALHAMLARYAELMRTNEPVHTWPMD